MQTRSEARSLEVVAGADAAWKVTLRDRANRPIATYTSAATLSAHCWRGEDQAPLFAPAVSWIDPDAGQVRLAVSAAQTAGLAPGLYDLMLTVVAGGLIAKRPIAGGLRVLSAPGSAPARLAYATAADLRKHAGPYVETLLRLDVDGTGFAEELADAREELDRLIQLHHRGQGSVGGPRGAGYAPWPGRRSGSSSPWLRSILDGGGLLVTRAVREYCALRALGQILRRQKDKADRDAGASLLGEADDLAASLSCEIDCNADGAADLVVHLGVADKLRG